MLSSRKIKLNGTSIFEKYPKDPIQDLKSPSLTAGATTWQTVSRWLPPRNPSADFWWHKTGPQFASLLVSAGYSIHQQYSSLLFHYQVTVPRLGPAPSPSTTAAGLITAAWKTFMTDDYTPIEYSWKWDSGTQAEGEHDDGPIVRYGFEALGPETGTGHDPLNQRPVKELLRQLNEAIPSVDLTWFNHFSEHLCGSDDESLPPEVVESTILLAVEFLKVEISVKIYFLPLKTASEGALSVEERVWASIRSLDPSSCSTGNGTNWQALEAMKYFLADDEEGKKLEIFMVSIDLTTPSESRLKIYVRSQNITFESVARIMTMGGRLRGLENSLSELREVWRLTLGLRGDSAPSESPKLKEGARGGMCYYFDIQQGIALPDIKMYIPTGHYGVSDMSIAYGLKEFLDRRRRGRYMEGYMRALRELAPRKALEGMCGVQTYIACAFQSAGLSLTCYLSPNVYREIQRKSRE